MFSAKRMVFPSGGQYSFLRKAKERLGPAWSDMAEKIQINPGTMKSYCAEYCSLPFPVFQRTCDLCGWKTDKVAEEYDAHEGRLMGRRSSLGERRIHVSCKRPTRRKVKLRLAKTGFERGKGISWPSVLSEELAEETGIHIGDGFLSQKRNEFRVKGDKSNERDYYDGYLSKLYKHLYGIRPKNREYDTCYGFEICSRDLWLFKTQVMKLPAGRKSRIRIPRIIKRGGPSALCAFLRGLMDTDGCFEFRSRYGREAYYPVMSLSCKSPLLAEDVRAAFGSLGFRPRKYIASNGYWSIYLYGYSNFERYEKLIGWRNPKNMRKVLEFRKRYSGL